MRKRVSVAFLLLPLALVAAAKALATGADDFPCTQNGFYYAVCPTQPELSNKRVVDGSNLSPLADDAGGAYGSKASPIAPQHVHRGVATASKPTILNHVPAAPVIRKNWHNYTISDWMSIISIFLLALPVCVVFYLVNQAIQKERRKTA